MAGQPVHRLWSRSPTLHAAAVRRAFQSSERHTPLCTHCVPRTFSSGFAWRMWQFYYCTVSCTARQLWILTPASEPGRIVFSSSCPIHTPWLRAYIFLRNSPVSMTDEINFNIIYLKLHIHKSLFFSHFRVICPRNIFVCYICITRTKYMTVSSQEEIFIAADELSGF